MTLRHNDNHIAQYTVLLSGLFTFVILFALFRYNHALQLVVGILGCMFYVTWGVVHHILEERLTKAVVLEYVLFGILVSLLLIFSLA